MLNVIKTSAEFRKVYQDGNKLVLSCFVIYYIVHQSGGIKYGVTVTKKLGNAVTRNRIKRRLRAVVMAAFSKIPNDLNLEIVLVARKYSLTADFEQMLKMFKNGLNIS